MHETPLVPTVLAESDPSPSESQCRVQEVPRIVTEHEGALEVQSEVGRGTRFTLHLPAAEPHETDAHG